MGWRVSILVVLGIVNILLFYHMVWGSTGLIEYFTLKGHFSAMQERILFLDMENTKLSQEIRQLQSDKNYIEKMVRQRLHYVRDNELIYLFDNSEK